MIPPAPERVLPQRPPFLFIEEVLHADGETARCRSRMPTEGDCFSLRMSPELWLVEAMAQTTAILMLAWPGAAAGPRGDKRGIEFDFRQH